MDTKSKGNLGVCPKVFCIIILCFFQNDEYRVLNAVLTWAENNLDLGVSPKHILEELKDKSPSRIKNADIKENKNERRN